MTAYLKLGATPDAGMTHGLMRTVGPKRALDLLLRHDPFSAEEALSWGLVTRVAPAGQLREQAAACGRHRRPCAARHCRRQAAAALGGAGYAGNPAQ